MGASAISMHSRVSTVVTIPLTMYYTGRYNSLDWKTFQLNSSVKSFCCQRTLLCSSFTIIIIRRNLQKTFYTPNPGFRRQVTILDLIEESCDTTLLSLFRQMISQSFFVLLCLEKCILKKQNSTLKVFF